MRLGNDAVGGGVYSYMMLPAEVFMSGGGGSFAGSEMQAGWFIHICMYVYIHIYICIYVCMYV